VQASAGEVDQKEATAYLINDALGRPIIEREEPRAGWPRKVGEVVSVRYPKAKKEMTEKPKAAAKLAAKGGDEAKQKAKQAAQMAVMLAPYKLSALPAAPPAPAAPTKRKAESVAAPVEPAPKHGPTSGRAKSLSIKEARWRAQLRSTFDNRTCTCDKLHIGEDHSMFCAMWHCYAHEVGCCEVQLYIHEGHALEVCPCKCMDFAFDEEVEEQGLHAVNHRPRES